MFSLIRIGRPGCAGPLMGKKRWKMWMRIKGEEGDDDKREAGPALWCRRLRPRLL